MIELLVFDVDGCLTDGGIAYGNSDAEEFKIFNVKDGFGIVSWHKLGRKSAIITGRSSRVVERRAKELGIAYLFQDVKNKKETLSYLVDFAYSSFQDFYGISRKEGRIINKDSLPESFKYNHVNELFEWIIDLPQVGPV